MEAIINYENVEKMSLLEKIRYVFHFISKVLLYVVFLLIIFVFLIFVVYFFDRLYNLKTGVNKVPLFGAYVIVSPSMVPTIKVNDAIIVKRIVEDDLKKGDIITFSSTDSRYSGLTITHRIVGIQVSQNGTKLYRTKGDANNIDDSALLSYDDIYGKVILNIPKIGYLQSFLVSSYGWLVIIVAPCLGVIIYDIIKLFKVIMKSLRTNDKSKHREVEELNKFDDDDDII